MVPVKGEGSADAERQQMGIAEAMEDMQQEDEEIEQTVNFEPRTPETPESRAK